MEVEGGTANAEATAANAAETKDQTVEPILDVAPAPKESRELKEAKAWKARAQIAESEVIKRDHQKLETEGKWEEACKLKTAELEEFKKALARSKIKAAVAEAAAKTGCINANALFKLGDLSLLSIDESMESVDGVQEFVAAAQREHSYLFNTQSQARVNGTTPGGPIPQPKKLDARDIAKLSPKDKAAAWANAMKSGQ